MVLIKKLYTMKRTLLASLAGAITGFIYGWVVYGMLLMDYMQSNMTQYDGLMKEESVAQILGYFVSNFASALLLTIVFSRWANINTPIAGLKTGALFGFLICLGIDVMFMTGMNLYTTQSLIVDIIAGTGMWAATGAVCALVLGKVKD
jgi:hypothetical protein